MRNFRNLLFLAAFFTAGYVLFLGVRPLFVPDEIRYAEIPREMLASGDWVTPRLDGVRYFEKTPMLYWLNALSMKAFGENEFAARIVSALSAGLSALLIWFFTLSRLGSGSNLPGWITRSRAADTAAMAAAVYLTFALVFFVGTCNITDTLFSFFLSACLVSFYFALDEKAGPLGKLSALLLAGAACGLAFLTKGFLALVIPAVVIAPFLLRTGSFRPLFLYGWPCLAAALAVALPWSLMIHFREPDFWRYFILVEHLGRFSDSAESQHPESVFYFIPVIIIGSLPWLFLLPAILKGRAAAFFADKKFILYCLFWLVFPFLLLSLSSGKLATYILPCFAPLAVLFAAGLRGYFETGSKFMFNTLALLLCGVSLAASVLFLLSPLTGAPGFGLFSAGEKHKLLMVVCALAATGVLFLFAARARKAVAKVFLFALAVLPVMICQAPALPDFVIRKKAPEALFKRNADKVAPDSFLVAYNSLIHTACWIYKRDDICLLHKPGELDYGLRADDAKNRLIPIKSFNKMTEDPALKGKIVLLMEYQDKRDMLPKGSFEDKEGEMFFIKY